MKMRPLGKSDLQVSPLMFGGNVFGWTADEATSFKLLDAFVAAGGNFIDTADMYSKWAPGNSGGESETIIGKWLAQPGKRDKVLIATKLGTDMGEGRKGLSAKYIAEAVEGSLKKLQVETIDLYQSHVDDPETPLEETLTAYAKLIEEGKVRVIGASNYTAPRLLEALDVSARLGLPRYESLQPNYNLYDREGFEKELEPLCLEETIGVISYFSLASGFLSGKYRSEDDLSHTMRGSMAKKYYNDRGLKILAALDEVAAQHKATPAQVAIAWLIARPSITAPIVSATSLDQLGDLIKATELELSTASIAALDAASAY